MLTDDFFKNNFAPQFFDKVFTKKLSIGRQWNLRGYLLQKKSTRVDSVIKM